MHVSRKAAVIAAAIAGATAVIIGLTMQATAYAMDGPEHAPGLLGLIVTTVGVLALAAVAPLILTTVRTTAHDAAYLSLLADQKYDRTIARTGPVRTLERRAQ